jgi:hypothetical protein
MRTLPKQLNDGEFDYVLVRPSREISDGRQDVAIYKRMGDDVTEFTPSLDYVTGIVNTPVMLRIGR